MNDLTNKNLLLTGDHHNHIHHHHRNDMSSTTASKFFKLQSNSFTKSISSNNIAKNLSSSLMETTTTTTTAATTTTGSSTTSNGSKLRLPSFKKLKSKLSIRKSHSTASNLSDLLNKTKLTNSTSVTNFKTVINPTPNPNPNTNTTNYLNTNNYYNNKNNNNNKKDDQLYPASNSIKKSSTSNNKNYIESIEEEEHQHIHNHNQHSELHKCSTHNLTTTLSSNSLTNSNKINTAASVNTANSLTPSNLSKENTSSTNQSPRSSQYSKVNTPVKHNPITEFLSSLSSSISLSLSSSSSSTNNNNNNNNQSVQYNHNNTVNTHETTLTSGQVKMRQKVKGKNEIQKRISLPANYSSNVNMNYANNHYQNNIQNHNDESKILRENDDDDDRDRELIDEGQNEFVNKSQVVPTMAVAGQLKLKPNKTGSLLNTKNIGFTSNHQLSSAAAGKYITVNGVPFNVADTLNGTVVGKKPINGTTGANGLNHIQSFQSLSSVMINLNDSINNRNHMMSKLNSLSIKPLNRNSRRASMSELGYGKIESYSKLEKLGEGTYATVYKGQSTINGSYVALKEIRLEHEEGAPCTAIREVSLLKQLKHANIVTLHDIIYTEKSLTLVFEYLEKDLKQYMDDCNNILSIKNIKLFLFQLLRGLKFCHSKQILHRDLKPQNLLINQRGELKLADFGLARAKSIPTKTYSNEVVTLWYRPPDVLLGSTDYSTHIDMWGVGCIFYEMVCGAPLFPGTKVEDELCLIFQKLGCPTEETYPGISTNVEYLLLNMPKFPPHNPSIFSELVPRLDADGVNLLASFLKYDPKMRVSAAEAIHHNFFSCFPSEIYTLENNQSIFDLPNISLSKNPINRMNNAVLYESCI